jgi:ribosomal protein S18 acetylase RimI-like enzyme
MPRHQLVFPGSGCCAGAERNPQGRVVSNLLATESCALVRMGYSARSSNLQYTVRAARPADAPAILDLWERARSTHATIPDRIEHVQRLLAQAPGSLFVADAGGAFLGTLIAAWDGWRGNTYRLVVLREHRRRGIGLALVRAGEEHLRWHGAYRITALVAHEDEIASAFWEFVATRGTA